MSISSTTSIADPNIPSSLQETIDDAKSQKAAAAKANRQRPQCAHLGCSKGLRPAQVARKCRCAASFCDNHFFYQNHGCIATLKKRTIQEIQGEDPSPKRMTGNYQAPPDNAAF